MAASPTPPSRDDGYLAEAFAPLKKKLDAIEEIRADLTKERIQVPGVVVIGNQSAGKSSLLEAICGVNFPRGENTCTRCPCIVRLEQQARTRPYAFIGRDPEFVGAQRIEDLADIGIQIAHLTKDGAGVGTTISPDPIHLKVVRPDGPTLSLIDLPGITHVHESQKDIHSVVTGMIRSYVRNQEMVILVVIPAYDDFGNAEALKIAQEVDPEGRRTLGVATKTDMIPRDSDILLKLTCARKSDIGLRLGWIAVRCRTPAEAKDNLAATEVEKLERDLFASHDALSNLPEQHWGMRTLVARIVEVQSTNVEAFIPRVKQEIISRLHVVEQELENLSAPCDSDGEKSQRFTAIAFKLQESLQQLAEARDSHARREMHVAARTHEQFQNFRQSIHDGMPPFLAQDYAGRVEDEVGECVGIGLSNFLSSPCFTRLIHQVLFPLLPDKASYLLREVARYMDETLKSLVHDLFAEFPRLAEAVGESVEGFVDSQMKRAMAVVTDLIEAEKIVFTLNTWYDELIQKVLAAVAENRRQNTVATYLPNATGMTQAKVELHQKLTQCEELEKDFLDRGLDVEATTVWHMQLSLFVYAKVVRCRICDLVPMQVKMHLVVGVCNGFARHILQNFPHERLANLMEEDPVIRAKRVDSTKSRQRLRHSLDVLRTISH